MNKSDTIDQIGKPTPLSADAANHRAGNTLRRKAVHHLVGPAAMTADCGRHVREFGLCSGVTGTPANPIYYTLLPHTARWADVTCRGCLRVAEKA